MEGLLDERELGDKCARGHRRGEGGVGKLLAQAELYGLRMETCHCLPLLLLRLYTGDTKKCPPEVPVRNEITSSDDSSAESVK